MPKEKGKTTRKAKARKEKAKARKPTSQLCQIRGNAVTVAVGAQRM